MLFKEKSDARNGYFLVSDIRVNLLSENIVLIFDKNKKEHLCRADIARHRIYSTGVRRAVPELH